MAKAPTQKQLQRFEQRGFIVIDDMLSVDELDRYGVAVDEAVAKRSRWDKRPLMKRSLYEQSFRQCINLWEDAPDVRPLTFHPRIGEVAAALLHADAVRIWHDHWAIEEARTVTAWIPFDGSSENAGSMGYVPGSHKFDVTAVANIFTGRGFDLDNGDEARGIAPEYVNVPRGSVAFHHGRTIHLANPNRSDRTRRVHTVIFFADGCTRRNAKHVTVDRMAVPVGAFIRGPVTPIAWPLPEGRLPDPPPLPDPLRPGWPGWPKTPT